MDAPPTPPPRTGLYKSIQVHTYRSADGKVEERQTIRDGDGNELTTISRSMDNQTMTIKTKKTEDGIEERVEDFENMEPDDRSTFEHEWRSRRQGWNNVNGMDSPEQDVILPPDDDDILNKSFFKNLFKLGFNGFPDSRR
jgi:hypothetical protein